MELLVLGVNKGPLIRLINTLIGIIKLSVGVNKGPLIGP